MTAPTIKAFNKRWEALKSERSTFIPYYRELSDYHLSYRGRFLVADRNKGYKRNTKQINNTSHLASRTLASGMMAGITSPARPWFRLGSGDSDLDQNAAVKQWLHDVQSIMYRVFSSSNFYNSMANLYSELGVFAIGSMGIYKDFDNVIRCKPYTVGSYCIGVNGKGEVDTFYREYQISVGECVKQFGIKNCSNAVQDQWKKGNVDSWVTVIHAVEPNDDRDNISPLAKDKLFRSVYYETARGVKENDSSFLRQSGFDEFPIVAPRWDTTGEDVYGTDCPGMTCLGDTKTLQLGERRMYQAVDTVVSPPLQGPSTLKNKVPNGSVQASDIIWTDNTNDGLKSIYDSSYRPDLNAIDMINSKAENRIQRAFYEDLFLMLANTDRRQISAREIAEKHEEKLLMLGPVLERVHAELLDKVIDRTFNIGQESGIFPEPPDELADRELSVEYVSVLAQAQRLVATGSIERLTAFTGSLVDIWPEARHKVDASQAVDDYAEALGVDPKTVRSDDEVKELAEADAQAQAAAAAQAQGQSMADTAKTVSETSVSDDNALGAMMKNAGLT